jgi:hypothetical protein
MVWSPPWWPDTVHCPECCSDKLLNLRWSYFHPQFVRYLTRELQHWVALWTTSCTTYSFLFSLQQLVFLINTTQFSWSLRCVSLEMLSLKCINLQMLHVCPRKEQNQQVGWLPPGFVWIAVTHWASVQYQLARRVPIQFFFFCHGLPLIFPWDHLIKILPVEIFNFCA